MRQVDRAVGRLCRAADHGRARLSRRALELPGGDALAGRGTDRDGGHDRAGRLREEVVALVVDDDEGREVLDLDAPDRFHAEPGVPQDLDVADAVRGQPGRGTTDAAEVEAAVVATRVRDGLGAVAL